MKTMKENVGASHAIIKKGASLWKDEAKSTNRAERGLKFRN